MATEYEYRFEPLASPSVRYQAGWRVVPGVLQRGVNPDGTDAGLLVLLEMAHTVPDQPSSAVAKVAAPAGRVVMDAPAKPRKPAARPVKKAAKRATPRRR